jgi:membrane-associated phospholipid phosphatase
MISLATTTTTGISRFGYRRHEWLLMAYFFYVAIVGRTPLAALVAIVSALVLTGLSRLERDAQAWSVIRDLVPFALIIPAYWSVDWVSAAGTANVQLEHRFLQWDAVVLERWRLRDVIEAVPGLPMLLDAAYLCLYAMPPLAVLWLYRARLRSKVPVFVWSLLLGTLTTYAALPWVIVRSPRLAYPEAVTAGVLNPLRDLNLWILDRLDITTSVFPSGHVAVAFSAASAMAIATAPRRGPSLILAIFACLVLTDTVYARYHYLADGLAAIGISLIAAAVACAFPASSKDTSA